MSNDRVLREAASAGLHALEAGPDGFLPQDADRTARMLASRGFELVGGFVGAVLHRPDMREAALGSIEQRAEFFAAAGGDMLIVSASVGRDSYERSVELDDESWEELFANLGRVEEIAARYGLTVALHPHYGTAVETDEHLERFLDNCDIGLCLDTGHLVVGGSNPVEIAERAPDRVKHVHLKDVDRSLATQLGSRQIDFKEAVRHGVFCPLGEGDVGIGRLLYLLKQAGYRGWYVLEQDTFIETEPEENCGPVLDARKSLRFLEEQFKCIG
jgi:inosose dehydratase